MTATAQEKGGAVDEDVNFDSICIDDGIVDDMQADFVVRSLLFFVVCFLLLLFLVVTVVAGCVFVLAVLVVFAL